MKRLIVKFIFNHYWEEIRLFTRWAMFSGKCSNTVKKSDYLLFKKMESEWIISEIDSMRRNQENARIWREVAAKIKGVANQNDSP